MMFDALKRAPILPLKPGRPHYLQNYEPGTPEHGAALDALLEALRTEISDKPFRFSLNSHHEEDKFTGGIKPDPDVTVSVRVVRGPR